MVAGQSAAERVRSFQLVYQLHDAFGRPPHIQGRVFATVTGGGTVTIPGMWMLVRVRGVLHVGVRRATDGGVSSICRMDADRVGLVP